MGWRCLSNKPVARSTSRAAGYTWSTSTEWFRNFLLKSRSRPDNSIVGISYTVEQGRFRPGKEEVLFRLPLLARNMWTSLAVLGRRTFAVPLLEAEPEPPHLNVVLNWNREVAARLAER